MDPVGFFFGPKVEPPTEREKKFSTSGGSGSFLDQLLEGFRFEFGILENQENGGGGQSWG